MFLIVRTSLLVGTCLLLASCQNESAFAHPECERGVCRSAGPELPEMCFGDQHLELFEERVRPLLAGNPDGSCIQCHLRGTGFAAYVREDACTTMACLMEHDLVNLAAPSSSSILSLINRAEPDIDEGGVVTQGMIDAEYGAFLQWIEASAACHDTACGEIANPCAGGPDAGMPDAGMFDTGPGIDSGPDCTMDAPRYCCGPPLLNSFQANVWANRGSCNACHDEDIDAEDGEQNAESYFFTSNMGQSMDAILSWRTIDEANPGQGLINCANPPQSLLILYPLKESNGGVFHGGGAKIAQVGSPGYNALLQFINDYCACRGF